MRLLRYVGWSLVLDLTVLAHLDGSALYHRAIDGMYVNGRARR